MKAGGDSMTRKNVKALTPISYHTSNSQAIEFTTSSIENVNDMISYPKLR
jgi:hypothetical protein